MKVHNLFDNLISPTLIRKCKKALLLEAKYNELSKTIENTFFSNYSTEEIEEIFNICESYSHPKEAEEIKKIHKKYLNHTDITPADVLLVSQAYKANVVRLRADNAEKYNQYISSGKSEHTED